MKGTYPENIDQIGDFYRGKLQDGNIEPSASLWESIESNLTMPDASSAASASSSASTSATVGKLASINMIWKGALIIGAAGAITIGVIVSSKKEEANTPLNEDNSVENKSAIVGDTIVEARNTESVTEKEGDTKPLIQKEVNNQTEEVANETLLPDNKIEPVITDTVIPAAPVQVVEEKEEKPKSKEKEAEAKPGNFFERKLKQQKDTSSHLFKPNK